MAKKTLKKANNGSSKKASRTKARVAPLVELKPTGDCPMGGEHEWIDEAGERFCSKCKEPAPKATSKKTKAAKQPKEKKLSALDAAAKVLGEAGERLPLAHKAKDTGGTKMFIYTLAATELTRQSAHDGQWVTIDKDLLPHVREGLQYAWSRGFLTESQNYSDYRIGGAFIGWEVPGIFDVEMQVRKFSLKVTDSR